MVGHRTLKAKQSEVHKAVVKKGTSMTNTYEVYKNIYKGVSTSFQTESITK
jgi:hypothetical protein